MPGEFDHVIQTKTLVDWALCLLTGPSLPLLGPAILSPLIQLHKKIQFAGFCFSYIISQCGNVAGVTFVSFI